MKARFDRATCNGAFAHLFGNYSIENIITTSSDHYVVLVTLEKKNDTAADTIDAIHLQILGCLASSPRLQQYNGNGLVI